MMASLSILCIPRAPLRKTAATCRTDQCGVPTAMPPAAAGVGGGETGLSSVDVTGSQSTQTRKRTRSWSFFRLSGNTRAPQYLSTGLQGGEGLSYKRLCHFVTLELIFSSLIVSVRDFEPYGQTDGRTNRRRTNDCLPNRLKKARFVAGI